MSGDIYYSKVCRLYNGAQSVMLSWLTWSMVICVSFLMSGKFSSMVTATSDTFTDIGPVWMT